MLVSPTPSVPLGSEWHCSRCGRPPGHVDDQEAFAVGYSSSRRTLFGTSWVVCAACCRSEAWTVWRSNIEYWEGLGGEPASVRDMLTRPF